MEISIDSAIKRIKVYAFAVEGLSLRQLAVRAGLNPGAVRYIRSPDWNPELNTLRALEKVIPDDWDFEETPDILKTNLKENDDAKE